MNDLNYAPVCGLYCGACELLSMKCRGCGYEQGKPFWTDMLPTKICPLYECCQNQKGWEHCGQCDDFPCKTFLELRDPSLTEEEFKESLEMRKKELKRRVEIGTDNWLKEKSVG